MNCSSLLRDALTVVPFCFLLCGIQVVGMLAFQVLPDYFSKEISFKHFRMRQLNVTYCNFSPLGLAYDEDYFFSLLMCLNFMRLDSALKKVVPNISRPKKSRHFLMKLPDNFQMREHLRPCRFHINVS